MLGCGRTYKLARGRTTARSAADPGIAETVLFAEKMIKEHQILAVEFRLQDPIVTGK